MVVGCCCTTEVSRRESLQNVQEEAALMSQRLQPLEEQERETYLRYAVFCVIAQAYALGPGPHRDAETKV